MHSIPERIGPYRVIEPLGKGGMGMVYRCEDPSTGEVVAVKTVKTPNPGQIESIRREIRALARLDHPGVVRIRNEGLFEGIPFYAMDFLTGVSLRQFCAEYVWGATSVSTAWLHDKVSNQFWNRDGTGSTPPVLEELLGPTLSSDQFPDVSATVDAPVSPTESVSPAARFIAAGGQMDMVLSIALQLSSTLAFLHGEGIIHGDLKPENILIRSDGSPMVIDFGLVTQIWTRESRESLEIETIKGGTLLYLAPEVLSGAMCDARADVYSFGCILYELLTGKPPFTGQSKFELLKLKMEGHVDPPSHHATGIPDWLDRLTVRMLARHARDRIAYLDDVRSTFLRHGAVASQLTDHPGSRPYLYRSQFAGRRQELTTLRSYLDQLEAGRGRLVMIGGESGIGKTRILMKLYRDVAKRRLLALPGECVRGGVNDPTDAGMFHEPLHPLKHPLRIIADLCVENAPEIAQRIVGPRCHVLSDYEPMLKRIPSLDAYPKQPELPANAARLRLYTALGETLAQLATFQKTVLFLDDFQWADDLTSGFVEFALRIGLFSRAPLMVICSYRVEEETDCIARMRKDPRCEQVTLAKLNQDAVGTIISDMLALPESNTNFARFLTHFSEGNPFFITEYLRTALSEGLLFRDASGHWQITDASEHRASLHDFEALPLPRALSDLIHRRLDALSPEARTVMQAASVLGKEFPSLLLWHLVSASDSMFDTVDELIARQILMEYTPGEMRFTHDKIRETIYEAIPPEQRREWHLQAAGAIGVLYADSPDTFMSSLAFHWQSAGEISNARDCYLRHARDAARKYALAEAEDAYRAFLALADSETRDTLMIRFEFCEKILILAGRHIDALEQFRTASETARSIGSVDLDARSRLGLARMHRILGDMKHALARCTEARDLFSRIEDRMGLAAVQTCLGEIYSHLGDISEARTAFEEALRMFRDLDANDSIANTLSGLAPIYCMQGDHITGLCLFEEALALYRKTGDRQGEGGTLGNIANIHLYCGDTLLARRMYEASIALLREIGDLRNQGIILGNLARIHHLQGDLDVAQQLYDQSLTMQRTIQNRRMEGITLVKMADIALYQGRIDTAREYYREAMAILEEVGDRHQIAVMQINIAEMERITRGNYDLAINILRAAEGTFRDMNYHLGIGMCAGQLGLIDLMQGRSCEPQYQVLRQLMEVTRSGPSTHLGNILVTLEQAERTIAEGGKLFRGEKIENIQPGLRKWLESQGCDLS